MRSYVKMSRKRPWGTRSAVALVVCVAAAVTLSKAWFLHNRNELLRDKIHALAAVPLQHAARTQLLDSSVYKSASPAALAMLSDRQTIVLFTATCPACPAAESAWIKWHEARRATDSIGLVLVALDRRGECGSCSGDVAWLAPEDPVAFRVLSGVDRLPIALAFRDGQLFGALGGVPTSQQIAKVVSAVSSPATAPRYLAIEAAGPIPWL